MTIVETEKKKLFRELSNRYRRIAEETRMRVHQMILEEEHLDEDGYPTEAAHKIVENFSYLDSAESWFEFIESIWYMPSFGYYKEEEHDKTVYHISTAGWSGNEGLIKSMEKNSILWYGSWMSSRRGGHYVFEVKKE